MPVSTHQAWLWQLCRLVTIWLSYHGGSCQMGETGGSHTEVCTCFSDINHQLTSLRMNLFIFAYLLYLWYLKASLSQIFVNPLQVYSYFGTSLQQNSNYNLHDTPGNLLAAFQTQYSTFELAIQDTLLDPTDSTVIARLGDDLNEFTVMVSEVSHQITCKMLTFRRLS